ncbi:Pex12 amino terminal region-domain-containing protein [Coniochaeta sp. 2T2.1]|nr:Pex12 amino terminal region-domain-containing protein [Coniochaeta sp. 2T2.1]
MATQPPKPSPSPTSPYPFASAPDIIRSHQKDAYFQGLLTNQLTDLIRRLRGARSAHAWASEARTFADFLYLSLTTLPGNRTLGEEYCDLVQIDVHPSSLASLSSTPTSSTSPSSSPPTGSGVLLPSLPKRAALVASTTLLPYLTSLLLPRLRSRLRAALQARLSTLTRQGSTKTTTYRIQRYLLAHLSPLTSSSHIQALTLAIFYFSGAYYTLSKRLLGLRYIFTTRSRAEPGAGDRVGYEVLGVLLVVQMAVRAWLHLRATLAHGGTEAEMETEAVIRERAGVARMGMGEVVSLDDNAYASNTELLPAGTVGGGQRSLVEIGATTHTPVAKGGVRFDLGRSEATMGWVKGRQQRNCTLCLEGLKDPAATQCGHVFCWQCIGDWVREKPECPLCRREAMVQHILPLRNA